MHPFSQTSQLRLVEPDAELHPVREPRVLMMVVAEPADVTAGLAVVLTALAREPEVTSSSRGV